MRAVQILISFEMDGKHVEKIRRAVPNVNILMTFNDKELVTLVRQVDVVLAGKFSPEMMRAATRLRWVQVIGAGVEEYLFPEMVNSQVILTNASGIHATQVSDHAMAMMLVLVRRFYQFIGKKKWQKASKRTIPPLEEMMGKTVGIVGLGKIGTEIARKAHCFGVDVVAIDKQRFRKPPYVKALMAPSKLAELLQVSDFVVISAPLTSESKGLIGEQELRSMKKEAYLINVSRGKIIHEAALIHALKEGWIAGAALDAFENEPLPPSSELWSLENVIITPHCAGSTPHYFERATDLFVENLKRFVSGRSLINTVDKKVGY